MKNNRINNETLWSIYSIGKNIKKEDMMNFSSILNKDNVEFGVEGIEDIWDEANNNNTFDKIWPKGEWKGQAKGILQDLNISEIKQIEDELAKRLKNTRKDSIECHTLRELLVGIRSCRLYSAYNQKNDENVVADDTNEANANSANIGTTYQETDNKALDSTSFADFIGNIKLLETMEKALTKLEDIKKDLKEPSYEEALEYKKALKLELESDIKNLNDKKGVLEDLINNNSLDSNNIVMNNFKQKIHDLAKNCAEKEIYKEPRGLTKKVCDTITNVFNRIASIAKSTLQIFRCNNVAEKVNTSIKSSATFFNTEIQSRFPTDTVKTLNEVKKLSTTPEAEAKRVEENLNLGFNY